MLNRCLNTVSRCIIGTLSTKILTDRQLIVKALVGAFNKEKVLANFAKVGPQL